MTTTAEGGTGAEQAALVQTYDRALVQTYDRYGVKTEWRLYAPPDEMTIQIFTGSASFHARSTPEQMTKLRDALTEAIEAAQ